MPKDLETQQWLQDWKRSVFILIPKKDNAKEHSTTVQLQSFYMLARLCSKSFNLGFNSTWTKNFQMYKLNLEKPEESEIKLQISFQFGSVAQSCPTLCNPKDCSTPGFPVHHQLTEFTQTHVHWVRDAIQPSHPLSSPSPPAPNLSQHQSLFQWVNSSHEVAKVLEFQLGISPSNE